jgi:hypothetical protein
MAAPSTHITPPTNTTPLVALRLAEEHAAGRYLTARKASCDLARWVATLQRLATEHPQRADYRAACHRAITAHSVAEKRTEWAYQTWQRAQLRTDTEWTNTLGRHRGTTPVTDQAA